jgi:hypothetical protein
MYSSSRSRINDNLITFKYFILIAQESLFAEYFVESSISQITHNNRRKTTTTTEVLFTLFLLSSLSFIITSISSSSNNR